MLASLLRVVGSLTGGPLARSLGNFPASFYVDHQGRQVPVFLPCLVPFCVVR